MEKNALVLVSLMIFVLKFGSINFAESRAYHKEIHELALYPERKSWCEAAPIRQEISGSTECSPLAIENVVCLGTCFSYSVPRAQNDAVIPPYCDACRPTLSSWTTVALNCTKSETGEQYSLVRNVEIISNCSCADCNGRERREELHREDSGEDLPSKGLKKSVVKTEDDIVDEDSGEVGIDEPDTLDELHKLRSVSAELKILPNSELMLKDNKLHNEIHDTNNI